MNEREVPLSEIVAAAATDPRPVRERLADLAASFGRLTAQIEGAESDAERVAGILATLPTAHRDALTIGVVACPRCNSVLLRAYALPERDRMARWSRFLAVPSPRARQGDPPTPAPPFWMLRDDESWVLQCRRHPQRLTVDVATLIGDDDARPAPR